MGGFAGGDEAGFWDEDVVNKSPVKQNSSKRRRIERKVELNNLIYTLNFVAQRCSQFTIEGSPDLSFNTLLYSSYDALIEYTQDSDIAEFFESHKVVISNPTPLAEENKNSRSNIIVFLYLVKESCSLVLSDNELVDLEKSIMFKDFS